MTAKTAQIPLRLVHHLLNGLSHSARTAISVIANEVHYSKTTSEPINAASITAQCGKVVELLLQARLTIPQQEPSERIDLLNLCRNCGISVPAAASSVEVLGDSALFSEAFAHLAVLCQWSGEPLTGGRGIRLHAQEESDHRAHFSLFSELFNEILCIDTIHAPLVDAAFLYLGVVVSGTLEKGAIQVELRLSHE